jgi:HSP20 family molecular chaperone IbpA
MIGNVSLTLGRREYTATLKYDSLVGRGLRSVRRRLEAHLRSPLGAAATEISQTIEDVTVEFGVPGYAIGDLILEVTPVHLRLQAAGRQGRSEKGGGAFDSWVDLPEPVDTDKVTAMLEDGVLTVKMVKTAWVRGEARRVPVHETLVPSEQAPQEHGQAHA